MTPRTSPVRVLHVTKGLGPGGAERLLVSQAHLADGSRVELRAAFVLPWKDHLVTDLVEAGVDVTCLQGRRMADLRWIVRLRRLVRREQIEVVHLHSPLVAALARVALRLPGSGGPALLSTEHNLWSSHHWATRLLNRATLPLQDSTLAVSHEVASSIPSRSGSSVEVVVHGADVHRIAERRCERLEARRELDLPNDLLVVATVANLRATKDYPTLLAAARLAADSGPNLRFVSVGQGPLEAELARRRDELGLRDVFHFLGYRQDPVRVLAAADVFCLPSRYEGLPIALVEALALGLPAVVTDVGAMPAIVRDGVEGRVVAAGDPRALAAAISSLRDGGERSRLGLAAADRALAFDVRTAVERQQQVYERLAGTDRS